MLVLLMPAAAVARGQSKKPAAKRSAEPPDTPTLPPPPVPKVGNYDEAGAHYQKGVDDFGAGRYEDAIVEFKLAYAAGGPPALLFNIAQAHRLAGNDQESLAYYREYLRVVPDAPNRPDVEARMAAIEQELASKSRAQRGIEPVAAPADPGQLPGKKVAGDGPMPVDLSVREPAAGGRSKLLEPTVAIYHPGRRYLWTGAAALGAGAVALGVGVYFGVEASDAADELDARAARGLPWTATEQRIYDRGGRDEILATSLIVAGSATLVTGAVLTYIGLQRNEEAAEFAVIPVRDGAQAVMAWGF